MPLLSGVSTRQEEEQTKDVEGMADKGPFEKDRELTRQLTSLTSLSCLQPVVCTIHAPSLEFLRYFRKNMLRPLAGFISGFF